MAIRAYVFDAYGTLFDVHAAVRRHAEAVGPNAQRLSDIWRTKQLEYSWVRTLMDRYRDFWSLTEDALDYAIAAAAPEAAAMKPALLDAYRGLDAYPEVRDMLARLKPDATLAILSNGSTEMLEIGGRISRARRSPRPCHFGRRDRRVQDRSARLRPRRRHA